MGTDNIMSVIDIIGIRAVAHRRGGTGCGESLRRANGCYRSFPEQTFCQFYTHPELLTAAAGDQCAQKIQHTAPQPLLHLSRKIFPPGIQ